MKFPWLFRRKSGERKLEVKGGQGKMGANLSYRKRLLDPSPLRALQQHQRVTPLSSEDGEGSSRGRNMGEASNRGGGRVEGSRGGNRVSVESIVRVGSDTSDDTSEDGGEDLSVSFGYHCRDDSVLPEEEVALMVAPMLMIHDQPQQISQQEQHQPTKIRNEKGSVIFAPEHEILTSPPLATKSISKKSRSFSCLTGAALSANATLANTTICNGLIGEEILPGLDSPRTFRKLNSSASATILELTRGSPNAIHQSASFPPALNAKYPPFNQQESSSFLEAEDVQMAGGAAGEDRVQAVCSEENGWLYCGIYDGFNGRDAADYLAGTFYENVGAHMKLVEWHAQREAVRGGPYVLEPLHLEGGIRDPIITDDCMDLQLAGEPDFTLYDENEVYQQAMMQGLMRAFNQTEKEFLSKVEEEMDERPELAMVGSCVLAVLIHGKNLYTLNLGDSRAVLATYSQQQFGRCDGDLFAVQLTESHVVDNVDEKHRIMAEHPDDHTAISGGRLKGKLKVTRAFGAGYLKEAKLNDRLMGILRVKDLFTPPYLGTVPCVGAHAVTTDDVFVVLGSDGLFDFFTNEEVVDRVHHYICDYPHGDPAKYMLEQLLERAAKSADITVEQLKSIPIGSGRRRKYHDDVTVIIVLLGTEFRTSSASTES